MIKLLLRKFKLPCNLENDFYKNSKRDYNILMNMGYMSFEGLPRKFKLILKFFIPKQVIQKRRYESIFELSKESNEVIFTSIYLKYRWGRQSKKFNFYSGDGSHLKSITNNYIEKVSRIIEESVIRPIVVDIGCGDFNIGKNFVKLSEKYIACDVVLPVIEYNKKKFKAPNLIFLALDATRDEIPVGDILILRQVLQHLSNADILKVIENIKSKFKYLIFTDHQPSGSDWKPNVDKLTGANTRIELASGLDLTLPPFNLQVESITLVDEVPVSDGSIRTFLLGLLL